MTYHTTYGEPERVGLFWTAFMLALLIIGIAFLWFIVPVIEAREQASIRKSQRRASYAHLAKEMT